MSEKDLTLTRYKKLRPKSICRFCHCGVCIPTGVYNNPDQNSNPEVVARWEIKGYSVECQNCGASGPMAEDPPSAVRYWDMTTMVDNPVYQKQ